MKLALKLSQISSFKYSNAIKEGLTAIFIILWLYVGITKLIDFRSMYLQMNLSPFAFFRNFDNEIAVGIPSIEILIGIILILKKTRLVGFYASFVLMIIFTAYVVFLMIKMPKLPCTCGGIISQLNWTQHLILNIALTFVALFGIALHRKNKSNSIN
jgi:putative oxidoreductase